MNFIERHDLWSADQRRAAAQITRRIETDGIEVVRLSFPDLHGILRGKALTAAAMPSALADGCAVTSSLLLKDTAHRTVVPVFSPGAGMSLPRLQGASDIIMVPDPTTFRVLPWLQSTGWMLCDLYFADGTPVSFSARHLLRRTLDRLAADGRSLVTGLEVELERSEPQKRWVVGRGGHGHILPAGGGII